MPPRYAYWTILAGGLPTSFRAAVREDLLPTLRRLQERHPDAEMKWFARGKLWASPEDAQSASERSHVARGRDWRPGGEHRDPREPFKAAKRERNQDRRAQRFARKHDTPRSPEKPPSREASEKPAARPRRAAGPYSRRPPSTKRSTPGRRRQ